MLHTNLSVNEKNHLTLNGADTVELAGKYGTPLYLLDEDRIRERCRLYTRVMKDAFSADAQPLFASKALSFAGIYKLCAEENMSIDTVSPGEIMIALRAGIDPRKIYFHGNAKTVADLTLAVEHGIGTVIVDNETELHRLDAIAGEHSVKQDILLRITPGIDPHTLAAISTGKVDSKFGSAITTGQAQEIVSDALACKNLNLLGLHCHIGSQIFDEVPFCDAADLMISFMVELREKLGFTAGTLNLGGGIGVRYTEDDPHIDIEETLRLMAKHIHEVCDRSGFPMPKILCEPGRSLVADAGVTLYTVQNIKNIPGFKSYAAIDGGMPDNPRYALYQSRYTVLIANKAGDEKTESMTVAGRCCESGDLIGVDMPIQKPEVGDTLAVLVTGAYNYAMSSNYNMIPRPPIVMISNGHDRLAVRRETYDDLMACHLL